MAENKRIAKNTVFMAVRMAITMGISLYTSRVVLAQLGFVDFGIYNVVGAVALFMGFFNSALAYAMQRFMNVELGQTGGRDMQRVFSACCVCTLIVTGVFIAVAEAGGMWFLNNHLSIPAERMHDARIVFQLSLLIVACELLRVPYNSLIIAHERMAFFAYNSIVEAVLKLAVVVLLMIAGGNKLLIYVGSLVGVAVIITGAYVVYCRRHFPTLRFSLARGRGKVREIGKFAGWNLLTCISDLAFLQGSPIILNIFFGVTLNATMGIANQVKTAVYAITRGMQVASNPQIIQSYAAGNSVDFTGLVDRISRLSFYIVLFLGLPIILNAGFILSLWLTDVPPDCGVFVRLMVLFCIVDSLTAPLWAAMQATGNIARYQIVMSAGWLMSLPLIWGGYRLGFPSYWLLAVWCIIDFVLLWIRLFFNERSCGIRVSLYVRRVLLPIAKVVVAGGLLPVMAACLDLAPLWRFLLTGTVSCLSLGGAIYFLGIDSAEREAVRKGVAKLTGMLKSKKR